MFITNGAHILKSFNSLSVFFSLLNILRACVFLFVTLFSFVLLLLLFDMSMQSKSTICLFRSQHAMHLQTRNRMHGNAMQCLWILWKRWDPHQMHHIHTQRERREKKKMRVYTGLVGPSQSTVIGRWEYLFDSAFESIEHFHKYSHSRSKQCLAFWIKSLEFTCIPKTKQSKRQSGGVKKLNGSAKTIWNANVFMMAYKIQK